MADIIREEMGDGGIIYRSSELGHKLEPKYPFANTYIPSEPKPKKKKKSLRQTINEVCESLDLKTQPFIYSRMCCLNSYSSNHDADDVLQVVSNLIIVLKKELYNRIVHNMDKDRANRIGDVDDIVDLMHEQDIEYEYL